MQESRLHAALKKVFGELAYPVPWMESHSFLPHPRLARGDFSSNIALSIAADLKLSAPQIAVQFIERLRVEIAAEWSEDNGFIVVKGTGSEWWNDEVRTVAQVVTLTGGLPRELVVNAMVPGEELPAYAALRLLAVAALQAYFALEIGVACKVSLAGEAVRRVSDAHELVLCFKDGATQILAGSSPPQQRFDLAVGALERELVNADMGRVCSVWVAHHTPRVAAPKVKERFVAVRKEPGVVVRMPNDGWLISRERAIPEILSVPYLAALCKEWDSIEIWKRFLFHAASSVPSALFDPAVASFDELASPWYAVHELYQRMTELLPELFCLSQGELKRRAADPSPLDASSDSAAVSLWNASRTVPYRVVSGVRQGEILEMAACIEDFCERAHRYLNSPTLRYALHGGKTGILEQKILAGLTLALSAILPFGRGV